MKLKPLNIIPTQSDIANIFAGYNHNELNASSEMYDMQNLTSGQYPAIATRGQRGTIEPPLYYTFWSFTTNPFEPFYSYYYDDVIASIDIDKVREHSNATTEEFSQVYERKLNTTGKPRWVYEKPDGTLRYPTDSQLGITYKTGATPELGTKIYIVASKKCYGLINVGDTFYGVFGNGFYKSTDSGWELLHDWYTHGFNINELSKVQLQLFGSVIFTSNGRTQLMGMGRRNQIRYFYYNTADGTMGDWHWMLNSAVNPITVSMCDIDGTNVTPSYVTAIDPASTGTVVENAVWCDTGSFEIKKYSIAIGGWVKVDTIFTKFTFDDADIIDGLQEGDAVYVSGLLHEVEQERGLYRTINDRSVVIRKTGKDETNDESYIVITGMAYWNGSQPYVLNDTYPIALERRIPDLDYTCVCNNRVWGCRYGKQTYGTISESDAPNVNEIYCTSLGSFTNWETFEGTSMDSYTASCGTPGNFTAAVNWCGYPLFFKEKYLHKVFGNYPSNFQIQASEVNGVTEGASDSCAIVNNVLYYKSAVGVCAYGGSMPSEIAQAKFGDISYLGKDSHGGRYQNKYYLSVIDSVTNEPTIFAYDTTRGLWHKEDHEAVSLFAEGTNELFFVNGDGVIRSVGGTGTKDTKKIKWFAEFGMDGIGRRTSNATAVLPMQKYLTRFVVRLNLDVNSEAEFYIQYNSSGDWERISAIRSYNTRSIDVNIIPKRCDHFRVKIVGLGGAKIISIQKIYERGSTLCRP